MDPQPKKELKNMVITEEGCVHSEKDRCLAYRQLAEVISPLILLL